MKLLKEIHKKESGQALILVLILLLLGGLIIAPLMVFMSTGLKAGQIYEERMDEVYAADAGIEDATHKIVNDPVLQALAEGDSHSYTLTEPVNEETVDVTVTKLSLIQGLLSEKEYKMGQPHEDWVNFKVPPTGITINPGQGWVEYTGVIEFYYDKPAGAAARDITSVGAFFLPDPGYDSLGESLIDDESPYDWQDTWWGAITFDQLETDSPETKIAAGGFAFIWRWEKFPKFNPQDKGGFSFKFKIHDPDWEPRIYFCWATIKQQDISYVASAEFWRWLIEATAGDTNVLSSVLEEIVEETTTVGILTWEINPPE